MCFWKKNLINFLFRVQISPRPCIMDSPPPPKFFIEYFSLQTAAKIIHILKKTKRTIKSYGSAASAWPSHCYQSLNFSKFFCLLCRVLKMCRRFRRLLSHSRRLKLYQACVFQQFLCLCELSLSRFVDLYLLIDYFYYCNQPNTNKSTIF